VGGSEVVGDRERRDVLTGRAPLDGIDEFLHDRKPTDRYKTV
jgi:hypothetical protein